MLCTQSAIVRYKAMPYNAANTALIDILEDSQTALCVYQTMAAAKALSRVLTTPINTKIANRTVADFHPVSYREG